MRLKLWKIWSFVFLLLGLIGFMSGGLAYLRPYGFLSVGLIPGVLGLIYSYIFADKVDRILDDHRRSGGAHTLVSSLVFAACVFIGVIAALFWAIFVMR